MKKIILVFFAVLLVSVLVLGGYIFAKFKIIGAVSQGEPIPAYENPQQALLVIDMQNDLTDTKGKHIINLAQSDKAIPMINELITEFDGKGYLIIYIKQIHEAGPVVNYFTKGALTHGSWGSKVDSRILIKGKYIIEKGIMDAFSNPKLDEILTKNKVNRLYIAGIAADQCVDRTTKAALKRKYTVTMVKGTLIASSDQIVKDKLKEFEDMGVIVQ